MTVAVPERTAPTPPWRPPTDPLPLTATQPVSLCYHGNFSLSLVDNDSDVSDDVVDADSIRSILELAEQCALGISAKDTAHHQDMYPNELSPPSASCEEATTTYQPCRFTAGVKRKLDFDSVADDETVGGSLASREDGGERCVSDYMDQQRMLEVSLCKMRRMEDPETSLRRCVLINNMTVKLKRELDHHERPVLLPKKRHSFRRVDSISVQPDVVGLTAAHNPGCRYDSYRGGLRRNLDDAFEKTGLSQCKESADGLRDSLELPMRYNKCTSMESDCGEAADDGDGGTVDGETPSIFGDIDNVFQSLLSCLGEPM
ncbi:uncharacterized protein [Asterias amurensis]|uniref:uncharacterized protein n=1 Tax=Asterias amurensis TaxID=7602 RepID=UPI003AB22B36